MWGKNWRGDTKVKKIEREGRKRWEECKKELKNIQEAMKILKKTLSKAGFFVSQKKICEQKMLENGLFKRVSSTTKKVTKV